MTEVHYLRSRVTGRIRRIDGQILAQDTNSGEWSEVTADEAAADVRYVRNSVGAVHSIGSADLAAAIADGMVELTAAEAQAENPQLFGAPNPVTLRAEGHGEGHW